MIEGIRAHFNTLTERLGPRGLCLLLAGTAWVMLGVGIGLSIEPPSQLDGAFVIHEQIPRGVRAALWACTGLVAIWAGLRASPERDDSWGFGAIMVMPIERCASRSSCRGSSTGSPPPCTLASPPSMSPGTPRAGGARCCGC